MNAEMTSSTPSIVQLGYVKNVPVIKTWLDVIVAGVKADKMVEGNLRKWAKQLNQRNISNDQ